MTGFRDAVREVKDTGRFGFLDRCVTTPELRINAKITSHWRTDRRGARTLACSVATPRDARSVCTLRASSELDAARMSACATTAYAQLFLRGALAILDI